VNPPNLVPPLLVGLVDDAAVFPPGSAPLPDAVAAHRRHRLSWYARLVGPLLVPASEVVGGSLRAALDPAEPVTIGLIGDTGIERLPAALAALPDGVRLRQMEVAVARRGEDPQPGLDRLLKLTAGWREASGGDTGGSAPRAYVDTYAEIPLTLGMHGALDRLAAARTTGARVAAKFRTGGLAAELFPTPAELAAVMCACRDRRLPFKLTAGLHHAVRHTDPETGFTHHGYLNVLVAALAADDGADVAHLSEVLAVTHPHRLVAAAAAALDRARPLWVGFGSCSIAEPLADLAQVGLLEGVTQ
jgi:hypothetical protein